MEALTVVVVILFALRLIFTVINYFITPTFKFGKNLKDNPKISVLIRCDNEYHRLGYVMELMHNLSYPNIEIIIALYRTSAHSLSIIEEHAKVDSRFRLLYIDTCRLGWHCSNWINFQLGNKAKGNYLLFIDSDIDILPGAIEVLIVYMKNKKLSLLSVFPHYELHTRAGKIVYPIFTKLYYMLVPRWSFPKYKDPLFDIAGNNFLFFEGEAYRLFQPFEEVKNESKSAKAIVDYYNGENLKMDAIVSNRNVLLYGSLTWKRNLVDASKNIMDIFGNSFIAAFSYITFNILWIIPIYISQMWGVLFLIVLMMVANNIILSRLINVKIGDGLIYGLPQFISLIILVWFSLLHKIKKSRAVKKDLK
ncbi:MAG: glycosyltransferase family A protein [Bacteroidales bacterium]|nr:glycosyltransferase family A protein [Bacteroidales bacterium]